MISKRAGQNRCGIGLRAVHRIYHREVRKHFSAVFGAEINLPDVSQPPKDEYDVPEF